MGEMGAWIVGWRQQLRSVAEDCGLRGGGVAWLGGHGHGRGIQVAQVGYSF